MDQSKSNNQNEKNNQEVALPKKTLSVEFFVGLFTLAGLVCAGYLAIGLGGLQVGQSDSYDVYAEFDNISGLKYGATVEIAGVKVGQVNEIKLEDSVAVIRMRISKAIKLHQDDIALIRTKGIIGDRYVKISRGSSPDEVKPGDRITETESVVDFEEIIGKIIHNVTGDKES